MDDDRKRPASRGFEFVPSSKTKKDDHVRASSARRQLAERGFSVIYMVHPVIEYVLSQNTRLL